MTEPNDSNFENEILKSELPCMVDFWAEWCRPCQMIGPIVEEIANEYRGILKVGKLDVGQASKIAQQYGIMSIPCLTFFKNGKFVDQIVGVVPKGQIVEKINNII